MFPRCWFVCAVWLVSAWQLEALTLLTWNVGGNGASDWSTNAPQVQAIGRKLSYLQPDVITFNEIPFELSWEMTNFVTAYVPGYHLARNSGTDGYIRSVIASRHPIVRSTKWLDGVSLVEFGYTNGNFTRDLFEAEIIVPGFSQPLHVFTTHLKANADAESAARRGAEASAISNFFVTTFLPVHGDRPYLLAGDLNEDLNNPPGTSRQPVQRLANAATGLRLTTPRNPINNSERTWSTRSGLASRLDYILPGGLLFSNVAGSQVFRTDLLNPVPPELLPADSRTASDHLPVLMVFHNPYNNLFRVTSLTFTNASVSLSWETTAGRQYRVEATANLSEWAVLSPVLFAPGTNLSWTTPRVEGPQFFRVYRLP